MRFRGLTKLSVDAKGRLAVPKAQRESLEENGVVELVVTADPAKCLNVYPKDVWEEIEEQLIAVPNGGSKATRKLQRLYIGYATSLELDGTGRMLLSSELREYAGIDRKAVLVGQGRKFELWDEQRWDQECDLDESDDVSPEQLPIALQNISF